MCLGETHLSYFFSDVFVSALHSDILESETSIPSLEENPNNSPKFHLETSHVLLVPSVSFEIYFLIHSYTSYSDHGGNIHAYIQPMTVIDSFPQPFYAQKTRQPSSSLVQKS